MKSIAVSSLLLFFFCVGTTVGVNPGIKFGMNQNAIIAIKDGLLPVLIDMIMKANISDISQEVSTPIGAVDFDIKNIKIQKLSAGTIDFAFVSPSTVRATMSSAEAEVPLAWHYRQKAWPHTEDAGTADVELKKVSTTINFQIHANKTDGRAYVRTGKVKFKIGKMHLNLHGGASWLYSIFTTIFKPIILNVIDKAVKNEMKYFFNTFVNQALAQMPVMLPLGFGLGVDYALTADPIVTEGSLVFPIQGEFYPVNLGVGKSGLEPVVLPNHAASKVNMFEFIFSEFTANTLGFSVDYVKLLNQRLTKEIAAAFPAASVLFTTDVYIAYAPKMLTHYGYGKETSLRFSSFGRPNVEISTSGFNAVFPIYVSIDVNNTKAGSEWEEAFTLKAIADCKGDIYVVNNSIAGKLSLTNLTLALNNTNVGVVNVKGLSATIKMALEVAQTFVNKILGTGIPLPTFKGLSFQDPLVEWFDGYMTISTSGKYEPSRELLMKLKQEH